MKTNKTYTTGDGREVVIANTDDKTLLKLYRYFMEYTKKIRAVLKESEEAKQDKEYMGFFNDMNAIKEAMREEIKYRSLRIGKPTR